MTKEGWYCGYSAAVSQDMTVSENLSKEILIGNAAFGISYRLICTPYSGTAGMLLHINGISTMGILKSFVL
jgi:hypothetical protein